MEPVLHLVALPDEKASRVEQLGRRLVSSSGTQMVGKSFTLSSSASFRVSIGSVLDLAAR